MSVLASAPPVLNVTPIEGLYVWNATVRTTGDVSVGNIQCRCRYESVGQAANRWWSLDTVKYESSAGAGGAMGIRVDAPGVGTVRRQFTLKDSVDTLITGIVGMAIPSKFKRHVFFWDVNKADSWEFTTIHDTNVNGQTYDAWFAGLMVDQRILELLDKTDRQLAFTAFLAGTGP